MKIIEFEQEKVKNIIASKCNCGACNCNCGSGSACASKCNSGDTVAIKEKLKKIYSNK